MIYLNGNFMPVEEGRVSVLDRGFIFGDGVYEVIPVYASSAFRLDQHLARLQASLDEIKLRNPHSPAEWRNLIGEVIARNQTVQANEAGDQAIYLQVTRGPAKREFAPPAQVTPTVLIMSSPLTLPSLEALERGVAAVSLTDNRWLRGNIKSVSLLGAVLLRQAAAEQGAAECVLFREGYLTEGSSCNIFAVKDGVLLAPPKSHRLLSGISYDVVLELAQAHRVPFAVREVREDEVSAAQELMLTSSMREVMPITTLDGKAVGGGKPGPVFWRLYDLFQACKREYAAAASKAA